ncbi:MAG: hypothetical protein SNH35_08690 [Rikenellaceae bacterium]
MLEENVMFSQQNEIGEAAETTEQIKLTERSEQTKRTTQRQRRESIYLLHR